MRAFVVAQEDVLLCFDMYCTHFLYVLSCNSKCFKMYWLCFCTNNYVFLYVSATFILLTIT